MKTDEAITHLRKFFITKRRLPTYEEMTELFGFSSKNAAYYLVNKLIEAGILEKDDKGKLLPKKLFEIPKLGLIHAGYPAPGDMLQDEGVDLYSYLLKSPGTIFSLIVKGDSMIDEGINDGDLVLIQKGREPANRDIVAAFVDGDWTLKQYVKHSNEILLVPANPNYPVIRPKHDLQIGGVVISVIRNYY